MNPHTLAESKKHRGFAFVTYASAGDAQDAIDNMDMNEMAGKVLKVYTARPMKQPAQLGGNRAGMFYCALLCLGLACLKPVSIAVWESEDWLQQHMKPLESLGMFQCLLYLRCIHHLLVAPGKRPKDSIEVAEDGDVEMES